MLGQGSPDATILGQLGIDIIQDTTPRTNRSFGLIEAIQDTVIASLTGGTLANGTTPAVIGTTTSVVLNAGCQIRGVFTAITLTSGGVVAYNL